MTSQASGQPCASTQNGQPNAVEACRWRRPRRLIAGLPRIHSTSSPQTRTATCSAHSSSLTVESKSLMESTPSIHSRTVLSQRCSSCSSFRQVKTVLSSTGSLSQWRRRPRRCSTRFLCASISKLARSTPSFPVPVRLAHSASST